jgi:NAD/NADP transhydrogenase beta subunit
MDAIIGMIVEAIAYLVLYLVDLLKWWRFIVCLLVAICGTIAFHVMVTHTDSAYPWLLAILFPVVGIASGLVWEYQTHKG